MEITAVLKLVGWSAVGLLVVGWLVVSFSQPGPRRSALERWSAWLLFTALLCLFLSLLHRAYSNDSTIGLVAFGFLALLFTGGFVTSLVRAIQATARADGGGSADVIH